jgi:hypothetical protein
MVEIDIQMNDIDALTWNELLNRRKPDIYNIYQTYEWAILKKRANGLVPIFIRVKDRSKICGGQLFFIKKELGALTIYSSLGGPICASSQAARIEKYIIEYICFRGRFSLNIRVRPGIFSGLDEEFTKKKFKNLPVYYILVNIEQDVEELWKGLKKNARQGVEKAERNGVVITEAEDWNSWNNFYNLYIKHSHIKRLESQNLTYFKELYEQFRPKKMAKLFIASYAGLVVAGSLFLCYDNVMSYHINASDEKYIKYAPNDLIIWHAILWGKLNGFKTLDMDDTWPDPESPNYGIHKFKAKWGGHQEKGSVYYYGRAYLFYKELAKIKNNRKAILKLKRG